jgi:hypothetical protein
MLYFLDNVSSFGKGVSFQLFVASTLCSILLLLSSYRYFDFLKVRESHCFLFIFFLYVFFNIVFDSLSFEELKKISIGTTNGMLFAYIAGSIVSVSLVIINDLSRKKLNIYRVSVFLLFIACIVALLLSFITLNSKLSEIRTDVFLITEQNGFYQRSAAFMFMLFLFLSTWFISLFLINHKRTIFTSIILFTSFIFIVGLAVLLMATSQLIGSNSGFVTTGGFLMMLVTYVLIYRIDKNSLYKLKYLKLKNIIFSKISIHILFIFFSFLAFALSLLVYFLDNAGVDIDSFRIMGFGGGSISSVDSRLELLVSNFSTHFLYSPIFGNSMVDSLTTGTGTYVHSSISVLTHHGIIGFTLFVSFLYFSYKDLTLENVKPNRNSMTYDRGYRLYQIFTFFTISVFALFSSFFTWMPFWFCIGLCVISFKVRS